MGKNCKLKEKQKWSIEKLHLDNSRKLRGIYFIDPEGKEFKETIKNARKKLETPVISCCKNYEEELWTVVHPTKLKQDLCVFWKLVNLQDCVWQSHYQIIMKTILQEKETIHCSIFIWFTNLFLASSHENSSSKGSIGQGMGKIGEKFCVEPDRGQKQERVIDEARTSGATVHFASLMDICHLKKAELEAKHQKYEGRVVLRGDIV